MDFNGRMARPMCHLSQGVSRVTQIEHRMRAGSWTRVGTQRGRLTLMRVAVAQLIGARAPTSVSARLTKAPEQASPRRSRSLDAGVPLAEVRANLPRLVDEAHRQRKRTLIVEQGRVVAAIVPVDEALAQRRLLDATEIEAVFGSLGFSEPEKSAVDDLFSSRR